MLKEKSIESIIDEMIKKGRYFDLEILKSLKKEALSLISKDESLEDILSKIAHNLKNSTEEYLDQKNESGVNYIKGISSGIYLPNKNNDVKVTIVGGNRNRYNDKKVDENTLFDVASVTKLFTLLTIFRLENLGKIDLNKCIIYDNPEYSGLDDFTYNDLIRLHGEIRTQGKVEMATSSKEAWDLMHSAYLFSNSREENKYTDMGAIIMTDTIAKKISESEGKKLTWNDIMNEYLFKPAGINHSAYAPETTNFAGNNHEDNMPHDPKARALGKDGTGHAGVFVNSNDVMKIVKMLLENNYLTKDQMKRLGEITFPNSKSSNKGNLGIYVKTPDGLDSSYTPGEYSIGSFSHQGWTGAVVAIDPNNKISQSILPSAIYTNDDKTTLKNDKPLGYGPSFQKYQLLATKVAILMKLINDYYKLYIKEQKNIEMTLKLQ